MEGRGERNGEAGKRIQGAITQEKELCVCVCVCLCVEKAVDGISSLRLMPALSVRLQVLFC